MILWETIKDKWLTWRTGLDKNGREYHDWRSKNIVLNASYVNNFFQGYKYVIAVDYDKVNSKFDPMFGLVESDEFLAYMYPNRPLGQNCYYGIFRGDWDYWDKQFYINDFGWDQMFVATNSEEDAIIIRLRWA